MPSVMQKIREAMGSLGRVKVETRDAQSKLTVLSPPIQQKRVYNSKWTC